MLDKEFDKLPTDADGRVKVRGDDIEIGYWAKKFPHYASHFFRFHEGDQETPSFELAENTEFDGDDIDNIDIMKFRRSESDDEFHDYDIFDYEDALNSKLLADKELAEFESQLATILGTEIVSATRMNDGCNMPKPRSEQEPASSPRSLPPFLRYMSKERIMDMQDARDFKGLVKAICVPDEELRRVAAMALVDIRDKVLPHFIGAEIMYLMDDPDPNVRKAAVQARGIFVDAWAINLIEKGLNDIDEEVREAAKDNLPKAMSVWKRVSEKEIAEKKIIFDHTKIHLDELVATALGCKVGDIVKCRDRGHEGWTTLYRHIISPERPKPIRIPSIKVWKYP